MSNSKEGEPGEPLQCLLGLPLGLGKIGVTWAALPECVPRKQGTEEKEGSSWAVAEGHPRERAAPRTSHPLKSLSCTYPSEAGKKEGGETA